MGHLKVVISLSPMRQVPWTLQPDFFYSTAQIPFGLSGLRSWRVAQGWHVDNIRRRAASVLLQPHPIRLGKFLGTAELAL